MPERVYFFPDRPPELAAQLWEAVSFSIAPYLRSGWSARLQSQWGSAQLDVGALRRTAAGTLEILYGGGWTAFHPDDHGHMTTARKFYRFGPGHSENGVLDPHDFAQQDLRDLMARDPQAWPLRISIADGPPRRPGDEPIEDVSYSKSLYEAVKRAKGETGGGTPEPEPPSGPKVTPEKLTFAVPAGEETINITSLAVDIPTRWARKVSPLPSGILLEVSNPPASGGPGTLTVKATVKATVAAATYEASILVAAGPAGQVSVPVEIVVGARQPEPAPPPPPPSPEPPPAPAPLTPEELADLRAMLAEWRAKR